VENFDRKIDEQRQIDEDEDDDDAIYVQRLSGGLFTLQLIDYIVLEISVSSTDSAKIKQRLNQILSLRGASMKTIRHVMREYAGNLGDAGDKDWRDQEQQHILSLVDRF
jgi:beta-catenin-like protein 1